MENSQDVQDMQKYLRMQIVDKGYSPQDFMEYLMTQKTSGEDISNWTYQELQSAVMKYKLKQDQTEETNQIQKEELLPNSANEDILSKFEVFGEQEIVSIVIEKEQRVEYDKNNLFDAPLSKTIDCIQYKGFLEQVSKINFDVLSYQIKNTKQRFFGLSKTPELWYTVRCSLINTTVNRSDSDFVWLRNTLIRLYPGHFIPPFNEVQDINSETDSSCKSRKQMAAFFLKSLFEDEFIFNTKLVISFLTWSQYSRFNKYKNQFNSVTFTRSLQNVQNPEGKVDIQISKKNMNICKAAHTVITSLDKHYQDLGLAIRGVQYEFGRARNSLLTLQQVFKQYNNSYTKFCNTVPECKNDTIANCLITVTNTVFEWASTFKSYQKSILLTLQNMVKYNKKQVQAARQMLQRRNTWKTQYLQFKQKILKKKQKIIDEPSKWQLPNPDKYKKLQKNELIKYILPKQSAQQEKMKVWLAYMNKQTEIQIQRMLLMNTRRLAVYWTNYGIQNLQSTQNIYQIFKQISNGVLLNMPKSSIIYE